MAKMPLAEIRLVLDNKEKELKEVFSKRKGSLLNIYKKKENDKELTHEPHEFTVEELTAKADKLQKEIRILRLVLAKANVDTDVEFTVDGAKISLQEAIYLVKQYRENIPNLKSMGELKTRTQFVDPSPRFGNASTVDRSYEELSEPTFNTKDYREKAKKIETLITKLEMAINNANYGTFVEVNGVEIEG